MSPLKIRIFELPDAGTDIALQFYHVFREEKLK